MYSIYVILAALLLPGSGIMRAMDVIRRHPRFTSDPIKRALRAGALCMVVRCEPTQKVIADPRSLEEGRGELDKRSIISKKPTEAIGTDQVAEANITPVDTIKPALEKGAKELQERRVKTYTLKITRSSYASC